MAAEPSVEPSFTQIASKSCQSCSARLCRHSINNVLVFPGLFRGALDARARTVNREMLLAAARGLQGCVGEDQLKRDYILPYAWDKKAHEAVAAAVKQAAIDSGVSKLYSK